nr:GWxTD domain-containing protein [Pyrinomonadaceae bacterium]
MSGSRFIKGIGLSALALSLTAGAIFAQKDPKKPAEDISDKARNVKPELKEAYKRWLNTDVDYIITKEEKRAFLALQTDEERENFIENFWRRRDPNPDTEENEYREEYYERI